MDKQFEFTTGPLAALLLGCALTVCAVQARAANGVNPPPLPPGWAMVKQQGGLNEQESKRHERAHHHKLHVKKDVTRDDTVFGDQTEDQGKADKDAKAIKSK